MSSKKEKKAKKAVREATEIAMMELEEIMERHWAKQMGEENNKNFNKKRNYNKPKPRGNNDGN